MNVSFVNCFSLSTNSDYLVKIGLAISEIFAQFFAQLFKISIDAILNSDVIAPIFIKLLHDVEVLTPILIRAFTRHCGIPFWNTRVKSAGGPQKLIGYHSKVSWITVQLISI